MSTLTLVTDVASVLMQLSVCFIPMILQTTQTIPNELHWLLPLALLLISLGYWESFAEMRISKQRFFNWFQYGVRSLKKTRPKIYVTASLLKLIVLAGTAIYCLPKSIDRRMYMQIFERIPLDASGSQSRRGLGSGFYDEQADLLRATFEVYVPFLVQIVSSCVCYYTGRIACKVRRPMALAERSHASSV